MFFLLAAPGPRPAGVVLLHKSLALDFEEFCHTNSGPLPLLGRSEPGRWASQTLSTVPDTR